MMSFTSVPLPIPFECRLMVLVAGARMVGSVAIHLQPNKEKRDMNKTTAQFNILFNVLNSKNIICCVNIYIVIKKGHTFWVSL